MSWFGLLSSKEQDTVILLIIIAVFVIIIAVPWAKMLMNEIKTEKKRRSR